MVSRIYRRYFSRAMFVAVFLTTLAATGRAAANVASTTGEQLDVDQRYFKEVLKDRPAGVYVDGGRLYALARIAGAQAKLPENHRRMKALLAVNATLREWALARTAEARRQKTEMPPAYQKGRSLLELYAPQWCVGEWKVSAKSREFVEKGKDEYVLVWAMDADEVERSIPEQFRQPLSSARILSGISANLAGWMGKDPAGLMVAAMGEDLAKATVNGPSLIELAQGDVESILAGAVISSSCSSEVLTAFGRLLAARGLRSEAVQCIKVALRLNMRYVPAWAALAEVGFESGRKDMSYGAAIILYGLSEDPVMRTRAEAVMSK